MLSPEKVTSVPLVPSGVPGLDLLLGGGFPKGRVIALLGEPGTGKTIISCQYLYAGALAGDSSLLISMNEPKDRLIGDMNYLGMDLPKLERKGTFAFVDLMNVRREPDSANLAGKVKEAIDNLSPKRIVFDSISDIVFRYPKIEDRLPMTLDLVEVLQSSGATSLLTVELSSRGDNGVIQPEEFLADGIIRLRTGEKGGRSLQILKMRGTSIVTKPKPYDIKENGVEIYPNEEFF
jgi:circadian clock protein KaiC